MKYQSVSLAALLLVAGTSLAAAQEQQRPQRGGDRAPGGQAERSMAPGNAERGGAERGGAERGSAERGGSERSDSAARGRAEGDGGNDRRQASDRGEERSGDAQERRKAREDKRENSREARDDRKENRQEAREEKREDRKEARDEKRDDRREARDGKNEQRKEAREDKSGDGKGDRQASDRRDGDRKDSASRGAAGGDAGSDRNRADNGDRKGKQAFNWNDDQRRKVREGFRRERDRVRHHTNVNFTISIGRRLPRDWDYRPVPSFVIDLAPRYRGYRYAYVEDRYVIISPDTYEVVAYIDEDTGRVYASSGGGDCNDVSLSASDRRRVLREIRVSNRRDFGGISIGFNIPGSVELLTFPSELEYDVLDGCRYVALPGDRIAIVAPSSRRVVAILSD